jgi:hypothetical protein
MNSSCIPASHPQIFETFSHTGSSIIGGSPHIAETLPRLERGALQPKTQLARVPESPFLKKACGNIAESFSFIAEVSQFVTYADDL